MKKTAEPFRRIGLIANPEKANCREVVQRAAALLARSGRRALADGPTARAARLQVPACPDVAALARQTDLLLAFGGDGTMLRVARDVAGSSTPVLGVNIGGLGFLTALPSPKLPQALRQVWQGNFTLESRPLIEATVEARGTRTRQSALNDFVMSRGTTSRMIELEVRVDDQLLTQYRCDGLIVSSPTGSTAYSLAAGGAIVSPTAEVFALTPICPHTLSNRSVIVSLRSVVRVKVLSEKLETVLTADGQVQIALSAGDVVTIRHSRRTVRLLRLADSGFFGTLRQKLHWSGSNV